MRFTRISLVMLLLLSVSCITAQEITPTPMPTPEPLGVIDPSPFEATTDFPIPVEDALGPAVFPANVNPLTGLPVEDESVLTRRPIVAKISNAPPIVRPQSGIGQADLVFEHYAEGGLTRFSAIFYSQTPKRVGSIRSARLIDYELVEMYKGLLAYSGASEGVNEKLDNSEFADRLYMGVRYGLPYYWRDEEIPVPHNMFTNAEALWQLAEQDGNGQRPVLRGMAFLETAPANESGTAQFIDIRYRATRVQWRYDMETGKYRRSADGKPHFDSVLNQQVTADNVVIIYAGHYLTDIVESVWQESVSWSIQATIWPHGDAVLFRDGKVYEGQWVRAVRPDLLGLRTNDGELLYFKPGNTFFQVVQLPEQMNPDEEWVRWE